MGVFLVYCVVQLRDSMMLRPHPALWWVWGMHPIQRVHVCATWRFLLACVDRSIGVGVWDHRRFVHGCFILYLLGLVFLLCQVRACLGCDRRQHVHHLHPCCYQSYDNAKAVLAFLDPGLKNNTYSRSQMLYAEDCRVLTLGHADGPVAVLKEALTSDIFMLAHFLGPSLPSSPWQCCVTHMWCCANIGRVGGESTYHEGLDIVVDPVHPVGACRVLLPAPHAQFPRVLVGSLDPGCAGMQFWRHGCRHGHVPPLC